AAIRTLDLGTVIQGSLAISSEIRLDRLLHNLIRIAMENAGARRGFLILADEERLLIEAEGSVDPESIEVLQSAPVERSALLPASIVKYVARTCSDVVLDDAANKGDFSLDPFVSGRSLKSVLCTPILHQGKLTGVLYLENNLTSGAFTPSRIEVLRVLSSQAAISIENARLYRNLQDSLTQQVALTDAHRRFVPHEFIKSLGRESITDVELGDYTQKVLTVLFSDIRGFTTLVEAMTPEQSIRFINTYLSHMEPAILRNGGFIDSYIGDAIMALFDAPDDADVGTGAGSGDAAVRAAVAMLRGLRRFNDEREREGEKPIEMGIGLNTGYLTMGTIGGYNRLKCGVIGDPVNLASRIESLTRNYAVPLLISEHTYNSLRNPDEFCVRLVDMVQVVGQTKPVTLYEVFDAATADEREIKLALAPRFETAIHHFYRREFEDALTLFGECEEQMPGDHVIRSFMARCQELRGRPLTEDWTGVRKLEHK
ncbi:MAG: adenylate/guanylate cyclase domain-containing protein, partial [Nannocystaceae bacterium]